MKVDRGEVGAEGAESTSPAQEELLDFSGDERARRVDGGCKRKCLTLIRSSVWRLPKMNILWLALPMRPTHPTDEESRGRMLPRGRV